MARRSPRRASSLLARALMGRSPTAPKPPPSPRKIAAASPPSSSTRACAGKWVELEGRERQLRRVRQGMPRRGRLPCAEVPAGGPVADAPVVQRELRLAPGENLRMPAWRSFGRALYVDGAGAGSRSVPALPDSERRQLLRRLDPERDHVLLRRSSRDKRRQVFLLREVLLLRARVFSARSAPRAAPWSRPDGPRKR